MNSNYHLSFRRRREVDFLGGMTLSPEMLAVFLVVAVAGSVILYVVANKKWGYTKKRERELEEQPTFRRVKRKGE